MNTQFGNTQNNRLLGYGLIALGGFFLLSQIFNFSVGGIIWPFFVIVPGLVFGYFALTGGRSKSGLIFPALIVGGTGAILLYQNLTGHWESWAYAWTLYPALVGLGLQFHGTRNDKRDEIATGRGMVRWSLVAFVVGFVFFELMLFSGFSSFALLLIGGGLYMIFSGKGLSRSSEDKPKNVVSSNGHIPKRKHEEDMVV